MQTVNDYKVATELRAPFHYEIIIPILILVIIFFMYIFFHKLKTKNKKHVSKITITKPKDLISIQNKYLNLINDLSNKYQNKQISSRHAFQSLSVLIRKFIYEVTNINVDTLTLKDIDPIEMPILYELVSDYYDPEFASISKGNIIKAIEKTRKVIEKWH